MFRPVLIALFCITATSSIAAPAPAPATSTALAPAPPPHATPQALTRTGDATLRKLQTAPAAWTKRIRLANGQSDIVASIVQAPGVRRVTLTVTLPDGRSSQLARLIERDGLWYVRTETGVGKYKPYAVPFIFPGIMLFLELADVQVVTTETTPPADFGRFAGVEGNTATYFSPAPPAARELAAGMVAEIERQMAANPDIVTPQIRQNLADMRAVLADGTPRKDDVTTGVITSVSTPQLTMHVDEFKFLAEVPQAEFDVADTEWRDQTADLVDVSDPNDLVMFGYNGGWTWQNNAKDMDGVILDIRQGLLRRIPFRGVTSLPGDFLPDRRKVVVCGIDLFGGFLACYLVDLKTGETTRLGGAACATGITLGAVVSPDGKTVAVFHKAPDDKLLEGKVVLIDLATGEGRAIGESADQAFLNWLPDGSGLVLLRRTYPGGLRDNAVERICRMDLSGKVKPIRVGGRPLVLRDGRILYQDVEDKLWYTCSLDGTGAKLLGDGLPKHHFPTRGPDGKRLIMMRTRAEEMRGPQPVVVNLADGSTEPVRVGPGLWGMPQW